jgi:hypothetical protein
LYRYGTHLENIMFYKWKRRRVVSSCGVHFLSLVNPFVFAKLEPYWSQRNFKVNLGASFRQTCLRNCSFSCTTVSHDSYSFDIDAEISPWKLESCAWPVWDVCTIRLFLVATWFEFCPLRQGIINSLSLVRTNEAHADDDNRVCPRWLPTLLNGTPSALHSLRPGVSRQPFFPSLDASDVPATGYGSSGSIVVV